jgi:polysaccharide export outer membrane protein
MRLSAFSFLLAVCAGLALSACTSSQPSGSFTAVAPVATPVSLQTTGSTAAAVSAPGTAASMVAAQPGGDYRVGALDVLDVSVFQVPDLARTVQVSANGQISLPLIGAVDAAGKTTAELQGEIAQKYSATYLQSPQVSVFVRDAQSQRVTVSGEVTRPGVYPTSGPTTLVQMIATAGGLTDLAATDGVVILRQEGGARTAAKFNVADIQAGKAPDPLVRGGDMVVVDRSGMKATMKGLRDTLPIFGAFRLL